MAKNLDPKCKQCRRVGEKLMLKGDRCISSKCAMFKRNYPPGAHGPRGKKRLTDYGLQLQEKQKVKKVYNLLEKQFKITFTKAKKQKGDVGENLIKMLEMRLDNVVYRLNFASSRNEAKQLISHGHFTVNDQKINIPSYQTKRGQIIKIKPASKKLKLFTTVEEKLKKANIPGWLYLDSKELSGKVLHAPGVDDVKEKVNTQMVVEFYSR